MGSLSLLQGTISAQESAQGLLHYRWILYQLSYQESPSKQLFLCICAIYQSTPEQSHRLENHVRFLKNVIKASLVVQWYKNPPANAGDVSSIPGPDPHALGQLSPCATTTEPSLQSPRAATTEPKLRARAPQQEKPLQ